ncbi:MAG TPA: tartrate dehydrogenase [Pseudogracilibacillus sp.]|nr:tartrate dehydrogenase [Pseudogracilibacillus sp.]
MNKKRIAVIPGDGIGPEVVAEGIKVMEAIASQDEQLDFEFTYFPWGCEYYLEHGQMMAEDGIEQLKQFDAIYLGAVGYPGVPDHISLWDLLLVIRQEFDQYINLRPIKLLEGAPCPINHGTKENIDMIFIRENSEGEYAGKGDHLFKGRPEEVVLQTGVFSRKGTERIIRHAYEVARHEGKSLTSISKANALNYSMVFWDDVFEEIGKEYPDVTTYSYLVDAAAMHMITDPGRFEVVVSSNLFGDILTDVGAALAGGMGLAAGANINPDKTYPSMFEPVHGSAPDIAGMGKANPLAAIWSVSQMFDHFGFESIGESILLAIERLLKEGKVMTPDLQGRATTEEVGDEIVRILLKK